MHKFKLKVTDFMEIDKFLNEWIYVITTIQSESTLALRFKVSLHNVTTQSESEMVRSRGTFPLSFLKFKMGSENSSVPREIH